MKEQIEISKETELSLTAVPLEHDTENLVLDAGFPPELGVKRVGRDPSVLFSKYEDQTIMRICIDYLPKGMGQGFVFAAVPKKTGEYSVVVRVCAKGIYEYRKELTIEVI
jgi:hypothetical protein